MAKLTVTYASEALKRSISFKMYLPNDREDEKRGRMKTLFLLHGYSGDAEIWVPEELARKYHVAVIAPYGENGFWLDGLSTGHQYATFVGEELVKYVRRTFGLAMNAEETSILGLSMGGFGALHTALAYPEHFGKTAAMSSALIVHGIAHMKPGESNDVANYDYYHECFGDLEVVEESRNNPEILVKQLRETGKTIPQIFMSCGTEDFLLEENRTFHRYLDSISVPHVYMESEGDHNMMFWNRYTEKFMEMMYGENETER